jgi:hypothetical protein
MVMVFDVTQLLYHTPLGRASGLSPPQQLFYPRLLFLHLVDRGVDLRAAEVLDRQARHDSQLVSELNLAVSLLRRGSIEAPDKSGSGRVGEVLRGGAKRIRGQGDPMEQVT